jgi:hypothetical protein
LIKLGWDSPWLKLGIDCFFSNKQEIIVMVDLGKCNRRFELGYLGRLLSLLKLKKDCMLKTIFKDKTQWLG